jgi:hypothetical protein
MSGFGWHSHLNEASTEEEVVSLCNQFLSVWTAEDLGKLPEACRPEDIIELEDVSPYALKLASELCAGDDPTAAMLHRMSTFFTKAAQRLAEIKASSRDPDYPDPRKSGCHSP